MPLFIRTVHPQSHVSMDRPNSSKNAPFHSMFYYAQFWEKFTGEFQRFVKIARALLVFISKC